MILLKINKIKSSINSWLQKYLFVILSYGFHKTFDKQYISKVYSDILLKYLCLYLSTFFKYS